MAGRLPADDTATALRYRGDLDLATALHQHRLLRARRPAAVLCNFGRECWLAGWAAGAQEAMEVQGGGEIEVAAKPQRRCRDGGGKARGHRRAWARDEVDLVAGLEKAADQLQEHALGATPAGGGVDQSEPHAETRPMRVS